MKKTHAFLLSASLLLGASIAAKPAQAETGYPLHHYVQNANGEIIYYDHKYLRVMPSNFLHSHPITAPFRDVAKTASYYDSIHRLRDASIITGYPDGTFKPTQTINRRQAGALIERLYATEFIALTEKRNERSFNDVRFSNPAFEPLSALYRSGLLELDKQGNISPGKALTRGEMAVIIATAFDLTIPQTRGTFPDAKNTAQEPYIEALNQYNITTGYPDGTFKPNEPVTRAHYVQFLARALSYFGDGVYVGGQVEDNWTNSLSEIHERWAKTVQSYSYPTANGGFTTVDAGATQLTIHTYDAQFKSIAKKVLPFELPIFGAFYAGETYNYVAYGAKNMEQANKEVIRIVKYDKQFNRIDAVSLSGDDIITTEPFRSAAARMSEQGGELVLHTSRQRYLANDGLNHQSQLTIVVDTNTMQVTNDTGEFQENHVGHSFNQFVLHDGDTHVLLDHGDAYPRSLVLHKEQANTYTSFEAVSIPGEIGANQTGVFVGGFAQSTNNYLVLYNEIDRTNVTNYTSFSIVGGEPDLRDIKLAVVSKDLQSVNITQLASYSNRPMMRTSIPAIVQTGADEFVVLWQEYNTVDTKRAVKYVKVNGNGQYMSAIQTKEHIELSYMQPIYLNDRIIWHVVKNGQQTIVTLDVSDL